MITQASKQLGILSASLLLSLQLHASSQVADSVAPETASGLQSKQAVTANDFMVAAANPLAAQAGYDVLKNGGTAMDAMIAIQAMLGLVEPQSSGLGGGAFLVYYDAERKQLTTFDGRETAPLAATPELFQDADGKPLKFYEAVVGGRSVGTPGTVKLMADMHARYGNQDWASLLKPAQDMAANGFRVSARLAGAIANDKERLSTYPDTRSYFFSADGKPLQEGHLLKNQAYADTLALLAKDGADAFTTAR
nr:gamma-glutamyltransferase [Aliamphritea spongicola]